MVRYSKDKLLREAYLFIEWYLPRKLRKKKLNQFKKRFKIIFLRLSKAIKLPDDVFVHRDFHVSNIMLKQKKFHLIDSQDAVIGNPAYDLASLIDDVRLKTSDKFKKEKKNNNWVIMPLYPYSPYEDITYQGNKMYEPPSAKHWLGTDNTGRDVFSRLCYAFNISISFALVLTIINYIVGILIGGAMGYYGGRFDLFFQSFVFKFLVASSCKHVSVSYTHLTLPTKRIV